MPLVYAAIYAVGLYGLVALAHRAGQKKGERVQFGGDDFFELGWYTLLVKPPGKPYYWAAPRHLGWPQVIDWKHELPSSYLKETWKWNGRKWAPDITVTRTDPRYGETRVALVST